MHAARSIETTGLHDMDRATFLLGALGAEAAAKTLNDPRDWAAFCADNGLALDNGEEDELRALFRA